jgi:two-component system LytT family response regulator
MKITCIIIDDEKLARDLLEEYLEDHDKIEIIATCKNGQEAIDAIQKFDPDLIFLDVHMPSINGFDVLDAITKKPEIIFTTAYDQYAVQAFDQNAVDYLLKPIDKDRFDEAIQRISNQSKNESPDLEKLLLDISSQTSGYSSTIFVQKSDKFFKINAADILYLEASGDYTIIVTLKDQYVSSKGISKLELKLDPNLFIRIHRSTIINQNHLAEIEKHFNGGMIAKIVNGKTFPISRSYVKKIRDKIL